MSIALSLLACVAVPADPPAPLRSEPLVTVEPPSTAPVAIGALVFRGPPPPNLLVVSLDTARRDYFGRYGGPVATPNVDRLLAEGVALDDHRSCSNWTGPSMSCLLSGRMPIDDGFWPWSRDPAIRDRPPAGWAQDTFPGLLSAQGYATALVTSNSVYSRDQLLTNGFDREVRVDWQAADGVAAAGLAEAEALRDGSRPWLLQVHFTDPHGEYCAPEDHVDGASVLVDADWCDDSYRPAESWERLPAEGRRDLEETVRALYAGEMAYWDSQFGRFWEALDAAGVLEDTLVVFVTDHGQQLFDHEYHGHGILLNSEENRSVSGFWARHLDAAAWSGPTTHEDVAVTLAALYGLAPVGAVTGAVVGTAPPDRVRRQLNYWGNGDPVRFSVVAGDHQHLYDSWGERSVYDLVADPDTLVDLSAAAPADDQLLQPEMDAWVASVAARWPHLALRSD